MVATSTVGVLLVLCTVLGLALSSHFMGTIIQWRPLSIGSDGTVTVSRTCMGWIILKFNLWSQVEISHRITWKRSSSNNNCDNTTVSLLGQTGKNLECKWAAVELLDQCSILLH